MSGGRADDLVVAGMRPQSFGTTSSPFDPIHRGTTLILFIDSLILLFVMYSVAAFFFPSLLEASLGFGAALLTMNWLAYRRKSRLAYWGCSQPSLDLQPSSFCGKACGCFTEVSTFSVS